MAWDALSPGIVWCRGILWPVTPELSAMC